MSAAPTAAGGGGVDDEDYPTTSGVVLNPSPVVYSEPVPSTKAATYVFVPGVLHPIEVYDFVRNIKDPEHPYTLEDLHVVQEDLVEVEDTTKTGGPCVVRLGFEPTVPHCNLAALIGLCLRTKLERELSHKQPLKIDLFCKPGSHQTEAEINRQVNDKERVAAARENPELLRLVETCIAEKYY